MKELQHDWYPWPKEKRISSSIFAILYNSSTHWILETERHHDTRNETRKRPQLHLITEALGPRCRQRGQGLHCQAPARRSQLDAEDVVASLEEELKRHFSRAHAWRV